MRIILSICFLFSILFSKAQWIQLNVPTSANIISSSFISDDEGWVGITTSGPYALIFHTSDGGITWIPDTIDGGSGGNSYIEFASSLTGYAVVNGAAFKTSDGGVSWMPLSLPGTAYYEPYFLNEDTGVISGSDGIFRTTNGGATWNSYPGQLSDPLVSIDFFNGSIAVGCSFETWVYGSFNSGMSWYYGYECGLFTECFATSYHPNGINYFTGYEDYPFIRNDLGQTVYENDDDYLSGLFDINWFDAYRCYAAGGKGFVVSSTDGGLTWEDLILPAIFGLPDKDLYQVDGFNDVYVFGSDGYAFKLAYSCITSSAYSTVINNLTVQLSDQSLNAETWYWEFGDGVTSTDQNPVYNYAAAGNYTICLTVTNDSCGSDSYCSEVTVCESNASLMANGSLDLTFDNDGIALSSNGGLPIASDIALQSDGKILTGYGYDITRFNVDGSFDYTFGTGGILSPNLSTYYKPDRLEITSSQKILVAGIYNQGDVGLIQLNPDGSFDSTFSDDGWVAVNVSDANFQNTVFDMSILSDDKILVAATYYPGMLGIARFNLDGTLDLTFGNNGEVHIDPPGDAIYSGQMAIQADDKIVIGFTEDGPDKQFEIIKLNSNGTTDLSFNGNGIVYTNLTSAGDNGDYLEDILFQPDGKIVAAGYANSNNSDDPNAHFAVTRYNSDGSTDPTFNGNGIKMFQVNGFAGKALAMASQPDGKILITGIVYNATTPNRICLARLKGDGTLDSTFGNYGVVITSIDCKRTEAATLALYQEKIYVGGSVITFDPSNDNNQCLIRYLNEDCHISLAGFAMSVDQLTVSFTDQSQGATSWLWISEMELHQRIKILFTLMPCPASTKLV